MQKLNKLIDLKTNLLSVFFLTTIYNDSPEPWAIGFQDGVSPGYTGIVELHDNIFFYLVVIAILVFWMLVSTIYFFNYSKTKITYKYLVHGTLIEVLWTIFPAIVLLAIAIPSFRLLYILDEVTLPTITVKVTGFLKDGPKSYIFNKIKDTMGYLMVKKMLFNLNIILWSIQYKIDKTIQFYLNHQRPAYALLPIQQACSIFNNQLALPALPNIHNHLGYFFNLVRSSNPKDNNSFYLPKAGANFLKKVLASPANLNI
jgi:hypothetical protein